VSWSLVKLSEIFEIARGGSPRPISDYITENTDGLNWISIKDASNSGKYISKTKLKIRKEGLVKSRLVKPGDFLLTNSMSFGRPYIMNTTGCIHDGWLVLSSDKEKVDQEYFYYLLGSDLLHQKFSRLAAGAVVKNLNINLVKGVEVPLPPLKEQKYIAEILDTADSLRQKDQQLIEHYTALSQSLFLEMFGDPITNPMGWEERTLNELCSKITDGTHHSPKLIASGMPYVTAKHVKNYGLEFMAKPTYISEKDHEDIYKRCNPEIGDVLYIKDGATTGIACINTFHAPISLLSSLALLKVNAEVLNNHYLCFWLNHDGIKNKLIGEYMSGAAIQRYTLAKINSFKLTLPPITLQHKFVERIEAIEKQKQQARASLEKSEVLFNSLLQRAFKGELTASKAA